MGRPIDNPHFTISQGLIEGKYSNKNEEGWLNRFYGILWGVHFHCIMVANAFLDFLLWDFFVADVWKVFKATNMSSMCDRAEKKYFSHKFGNLCCE